MIAHAVSDPSVVWYGGIGHKLLTMDGGGVECYRCGMAAEPDAPQEYLPDCTGPDVTGHHWTPDGRGGIECVYGDARISPHGSAVDPSMIGGCTRG